MNTGNTSAPPAKDPFRDAIEARALAKSSSGHVIIQSESSGARAPWLFDLRAVSLDPDWLDRYAEIFWERFEDRLPFQVGGMETAGIPLVAAIVLKGKARGTPVNGFYIRKSRKRSGLMKYIEGTLNNDPIVLVDDLVNSGGSIRKQVDILAREGKTVRDAFTVIAFRDDASYDPLRADGIRLSYLYTPRDFGLELVEDKPESPEPYAIRWRRESPAPSYHLVVNKHSPALGADRVFVGRDDGVFSAYDRMSGDLLWSFSVGRHPAGKGILSSPAVHGEHVYFGAYDGSVYALSCATGAKRWSYDEADWVGSSPALAPDLGLLYIGCEYGLFGKHGGIVAIDLATGSERWRGSHVGLTHGSPVYIKNESKVVIGSNDGIVYAYDAATGKEVWRRAMTGEIKMAPAYDEQNRTVVVGCMNGTVAALSIDTGTPVQAKEIGAGVYSTPLVRGGTIYIASLDKCLYAVDAASWSTRWVAETGGRIFSSPAWRNGSVWIGSNDGSIYSIDEQTGSKTRAFRTTERIVGMPALCDDGSVIFSTVDGDLYCVEPLQK